MGIKSIIAQIKTKKIKSKFLTEWRKKNARNNVVPVSIFPIDLVEIGRYSYGELNLTAYDKSNKTDKLCIGDFVAISTGVKFLLHENHQISTFTTFPLKSVLFSTPYSGDMVAKGSIQIEDEVWIGNGVTILSGVTVGKGAIIATGAVVVKDIPPYAIAAGIPAKVIKYRFSQQIIKRMLPLRLSNLSEKSIKKNIDLLYSKIEEDTLRRIEMLFNVEATNAEQNGR